MWFFGCFWLTKFQHQVSLFSLLKCNWEIEKLGQDTPIDGKYFWDNDEGASKNNDPQNIGIWHPSLLFMPPSFFMMFLEAYLTPPRPLKLSHHFWNDPQWLPKVMMDLKPSIVVWLTQ